MAKPAVEHLQHVNIALSTRWRSFCQSSAWYLWTRSGAPRRSRSGSQAFLTRAPGSAGHCIPIDPTTFSTSPDGAVLYPFRFVS